MGVTWASALGWRLSRQFLGRDRAGSVAEVVERLVAVPAWSGDARTAIGLRTDVSTRGDVDDAIAAGAVFATYAFRGSTHLMTPSSASVHLAIRCAGRQWERRSWSEHYRIEPADWPRLRAKVRDVLRGGPLTQLELASAVAEDPDYAHLRPAFEHRSHTFLKPFAWQGDLCFSPSRGEPSFRSFESVDGWRGLAELDDAGPDAVRAYLTAYGPATRMQIHYWLGEGLSAGSRRIDTWLEQLGDELTALSIDGVDAFCLTRDAEAIADAAGSSDVVLLPGSDQWVMGAGTSDTTILPAGHRAAATHGANLVLVGGRVSGTWRADGSILRVQWFDDRPKIDADSLEAAVDRLSRASEAALRITTD